MSNIDFIDAKEGPNAHQLASFDLELRSLENGVSVQDQLRREMSAMGAHVVTTGESSRPRLVRLVNWVLNTLDGKGSST